MSDINAATIKALGNSLETIEFVERTPGAGFRIILHMRTRYGSPVVETCSRRFLTLRDADEFAAEEFGAIEVGALSAPKTPLVDRP